MSTKLSALHFTDVDNQNSELELHAFSKNGPTTDHSAVIKIFPNRFYKQSVFVFGQSPWKVRLRSAEIIGSNIV